MYFKPGTTSRVQCDIGGFAHCVVMNPNGSLGGTVAANFDSTGYMLIPGVLHAYRASATDLAGYVMPAAVAAVPEPGTWALMLAGLCAVGWMARRRGR